MSPADCNFDPTFRRITILRSVHRVARLHKTLPELALESAMIVLSVLLALAASAWAESRKQQHLTEQARQSFVQEIRANRQRVASALPYHEALTRAVLQVDSAGGVTTYAQWRRRVPIWSGFAPPDVAATAWQSALTTGALSNMPYGHVSALSSLYTIQTKLDDFTIAYLPLFDFSDQVMPGTVRRMNVYMQTVLSYEHALMQRYDSTLRVLGANVQAR